MFQTIKDFVVGLTDHAAATASQYMPAEYSRLAGIVTLTCLLMILAKMLLRVADSMVYSRHEYLLALSTTTLIAGTTVTATWTTIAYNDLFVGAVIGAAFLGLIIIALTVLGLIMYLADEIRIYRNRARIREYGVD